MERPLEDEPHGDVVWVKARATLLGAAPRGREMDDGGEVEAEAALVLTVPWTDDDADGLIVIEGSYRRLLKTLDYARSALIDTAPELIPVADPDTGDDDLGEVPGLRCPHCGFTTWEFRAGGEAGVVAVDAGDRYVDLWLRDGSLVGDFRPPLPIERDHYECRKCQRPVSLPPGTEVTG